MPATRLSKVLVALAALLASATLGRAAPPGLEAPLQAGTLTGQLLVASPEIGDPRFRHAVILLVRHGEGGAFGIVLNHPIGDWTWARLLGATGQDAAGATGSVRVFAGGPVEATRGFVLHGADYHRDGTVGIDGKVAMTANPAILGDIARGTGPKQSLIAFGYAGWAPGQLEHELALHGWFTIPDDPKLVFDDDRDKIWDEAMARRTIAL